MHNPILIETMFHFYVHQDNAPNPCVGETAVKDAIQILIDQGLIKIRYMDPESATIFFLASFDITQHFQTILKSLMNYKVN